MQSFGFTRQAPRAERARASPRTATRSSASRVARRAASSRSGRRSTKAATTPSSPAGATLDNATIAALCSAQCSSSARSFAASTCAASLSPGGAACARRATARTRRAQAADRLRSPHNQFTKAAVTVLSQGTTTASRAASVLSKRSFSIAASKCRAVAAAIARQPWKRRAATAVNQEATAEAAVSVRSISATHETASSSSSATHETASSVSSASFCPFVVLASPISACNSPHSSMFKFAACSTRSRSPTPAPASGLPSALTRVAAAIAPAREPRPMASRRQARTFSSA
mmetsp:Transcript_87734/g.246505  ORF Transcript_87734/g.246505 Transcript_87734/m.246505 type:complete len:288 (+) Transcript_87734:1540-2403(+)